MNITSNKYNYIMFDNFAEKTEDINKAKFCFTYDTCGQMSFMYHLAKNGIFHNLYTEDKGLSYFNKYDNQWEQINIDDWNLSILSAVIKQLE